MRLEARVAWLRRRQCGRVADPLAKLVVGEDDPAVYRSGSSKKKSAESETAHPAPKTNGTGKATSTDAPGSSQEHSPNGKHKRTTSTANSAMDTAASDHEREASEDEDAEADEEADEDDGTLLTVQPGFNRLLLVLRDERVMRFVKYVSAAAEGSRWDVCAEFEIGMVQEEEEEGEGSE